jgi:hypothetical protein
MFCWINNRASLSSCGVFLRFQWCLHGLYLKHTDDMALVQFLFCPIRPFTKEAAKQLTDSSGSSRHAPGWILSGRGLGPRSLPTWSYHNHCGRDSYHTILVMIPSLLSRMVWAKNRTVLPKKIELIWVCCEIGLIGFIQDSSTWTACSRCLLYWTWILQFACTTWVPPRKEDPNMDVSALTARMDSDEIQVDAKNPMPPSANSANHDSTSAINCW